MGTKYRLFNPMRSTHSHHHNHNSHDSSNSSVKGTGTEHNDHNNAPTNDPTTTTSSSSLDAHENHNNNNNNSNNNNDHHHHHVVPSDLATITRIRLMLGEQTALALVITTALSPSPNLSHHFTSLLLSPLSPLFYHP